MDFTYFLTATLKHLTSESHLTWPQIISSLTSFPHSPTPRHFSYKLFWVVERDKLINNNKFVAILWNCICHCYSYTMYSIDRFEIVNVLRETHSSLQNAFHFRYESRDHLKTNRILQQTTEIFINSHALLHCNNCTF